MRNTAGTITGDELDHQPGELVDAEVEAGQLPLTENTGGQRSQIAPAPGVDDHGGRGSALHNWIPESRDWEVPAGSECPPTPGRPSFPAAGLRR